MKKQTPSKSKRKRRIETRPIASLKAHPSQADLFADMGDAELRLLADDIKKNGLINAIEILPDGTIIAGHQRVRAYEMLKRTKIRCWIRGDLERRSEDAIEQRLIEDNLNRRQLSPLAKARCFVRLKQLTREGKHPRENGIGDLRDQLGDQFNLSGRQLGRYAKMLDAPLPVQFAFESDELTQAQVLAVTRLDDDEQQEVAERIENGELPSEVVQAFIDARKKTIADNIPAVVHRMMRVIRESREQLEPQFDNLPGRELRFDLEALKRGEQFLKKLRQHIELANDLESEAFEELWETN